MQVAFLLTGSVVCTGFCHLKRYFPFLFYKDPGYCQAMSAWEEYLLLIFTKVTVWSRT